jgi:triacylglycerol esterase/lipase EstA (alpha/beta hydrolase family)
MSLLLAAAAAAQQVPEREQAIADRLAERRVPGEMIWLEAGASRFLGLFLAAPGADARRVALLLHGFGAHPDWPEVVQPLRTRLPELGWSTFAIQLPRLSPEASHADENQLPRGALLRMQVANRYLVDRGVEQMAVVGYGFGAAVGAQYAGNAASGLVAFAAVSLRVPAHLTPAVSYPESLETVRVPVLDVHAARDDATVLQQAPERELWGRKNKTRSFDRIVIPDAGAGYVGREDELARAIAGWLDAVAAPLTPGRLPFPEDAPATTPHARARDRTDARFGLLTRPWHSR